MSDIVLSNKIAWNVGRAPLPEIGDPQELWRELCDVRLESCLIDLIQDERAQLRKALDNLPRPIILIHTAGATSPESKDIPANIAVELCRLLLDMTNGSLVLLDWDGRMPQISDDRIINASVEWGRISLAQLAGLMHEGSLLIGVDSGPYHFAALTPIPVLGVFHHHYPSCLALPRSNVANMARSRLRPSNVARRATWNIVEYNDEMPTAEEIAKHAKRMLTSPRYRLSIGRDVMLQHWITDLCCNNSKASLTCRGNRTIDFLLQEMRRRFTNPTIAEVSSMGSDANLPIDSTHVFGAYLEGLGSGHLFLVNRNAGRARLAATETQDWRKYVTTEYADPSAWFAATKATIDLLYLGFIQDPTRSAECYEQALREVRAAMPRLGKASMIMFSDSFWSGDWIGTGNRAIPYLLEHGWHVVSSRGQTLLSRVG